MNFNFTEAWTNFNSSLVRGVWYDADTHRMLVRLDGGKQYVYNNVDRAQAADIGDAESEGGSAGSEYNYFRNHRGTNQSGSYAHDYVPVARNVIMANGGLTVKAGYLTPQQATATLYGGNTVNVVRQYAVTYVLEGKEFTSNVKADVLERAVVDVLEKFKSLGLKPNLTGVVEKT